MKIIILLLLGAVITTVAGTLFMNRGQSSIECSPGRPKADKPIYRYKK